MSEEDINKLTETITNKLVDYLDIDKQEVLTQVVKEAITEIIKK